MSAVIYFTTAAIFYSTVQRTPRQKPQPLLPWKESYSNLGNLSGNALVRRLLVGNLNKSNFPRTKANIIASERRTLDSAICIFSTVIKI